MESNKKTVRNVRARRVRRPERSQEGTAMIIALAVMGLLAIFVAASLSRVTTDIRISANEQAMAKSYFVAQASLEHMSRNFTQLYKRKISPTTSDISAIEADRPTDYLAAYNIDQTLTAVGGPVQTTIGAGSLFAGLNATRTAWLATSEARLIGTDGARTRLTRTFNNYTIPIFQFGIFFDGDLEFHPGPAFAFGGRVHTNGDLYLAGDNLTFNSRVSAHGEVVTDRVRSGYTRPGNWGLNVSIIDGLPSSHMTTLTAAKTAAGASTEGSVIEGPDLLHIDADRYDGSANPKWDAIATQFRGNLLARQDRLDLPLTKSPSPDNQGPVELIRRPRAGDDDILTQSRYANKPCLRITLSDTQAKLPGGGGGIRLDGEQNGTSEAVDADALTGLNTAYQGYWPAARTATPTTNNPGTDPAPLSRATRINGFRFRPVTNRHQWIKAEIVVPNPATGVIATQDVTVSLLSLGVTQSQTINATRVGDPNAVIELQRFAIEGPALKVNQSNVFDSSITATAVTRALEMGTALRPPPVAGGWQVYNYLGAAPTGQSWVGAEINRLLGGFVEAKQAATYWTATTFATAPSGDFPAQLTIHPVPVPIMLFDTREGLYYENLSNSDWTNLYQNGLPAGTSRVPVNGVMSTVNINMTNFKRLVRGDFDGTMAGTLTSTDFPVNAARGWIVYVSDRRNDLDDDGQYDMEDVYTNSPTTVGTLTGGEDVNKSGALEDNVGTISNTGTLASGLGEGATYATSVETDIAALQDTSFYRRAVRVYNGEQLPGSNTYGFTLASENGVYVQGNFNASGVTTAAGLLSPYTDYTSTSTQTYPTSTTTIVNPPASIVADAITVLSQHWRDGQSFRFPFFAGDAAAGGRSGNETTVRAAFLMGNARSAANLGSEPQQAAGKEAHLSGGVHNFKRYIEVWTTRFNYCGSLINVFNSTNSNGTYKNGVGHTYNPPTQRNWVFDSNFLDPTRLPPGTPFFQYLNFTGFRQSYVDSTS